MTDRETEETYSEYDVVVVGHGMAGVAAGLAAYEEGATPVLLEKSPREEAGGHSRFTEGFRIPFERPEDVRDDFGLDESPPRYPKEAYRNDLEGVSDGRADSRQVDVVVDGSYDALRWLREKDIEFHLVREAGSSASLPSFRVVGDLGEHIRILTERMEALGIDRHYDTEMRELVTGSRNQIQGVNAITESGWVRYDAPAVTICAGGFVASEEKRTRYYGRDADAYVVRGSRHVTGEPIDAALAIGARPAGQWGNAHQVMADHRSDPVEAGQTKVVGYQYGLVLNDDGKRFLDEGEDVRRKTYAKFGKAVFDQPNQRAYVIGDASVADLQESKMGSEPARADDLEDLVARVGIRRPETAIETVREYNAGVGDSEFDPGVLDGKRTRNVEPPKSNWAVAIDEPPFHCLTVVPAITFSFGGLDIDADSRVIDTRGAPIEGLWAAGNSTAGLYHDGYLGGTALTRALVFGRRAGRNAAAHATSAGV